MTEEAGLKDIPLTQNFIRTLHKTLLREDYTVHRLSLIHIYQQRLAREGMVMKNGVAPSEDAVKYERLVVELALSLIHI